MKVLLRYVKVSCPGRTDARDIQMIIPLPQLRIPHTTNMKDPTFVC